MISVIIPTYNPNLKRLEQTIANLKGQTLEQRNWELIVIDNNSSTKFTQEIDISWHPDCKIVSENKQGLTFARLKGIVEAKYDIIIMVDDDNILERSYLENTYAIFDNYPKLGAIGGKSIAMFESTPPDFVKDFEGLLALRDLGNEIHIESFTNRYPDYAPIGAGMVFRKQAILPYIEKISSTETAISDRKGDSLSSSGDNDMVMEIIKSGWDVGYFPQLILQHIIPETRTTKAYLARLNFSIQKSWVQFLLSHNLSPWPRIASFTLPLRKIKAWFAYKAWRNDMNYIKWKGACGTFEGLRI